MRLALAVVSLVVLVGSGVVVYDQFQSPWQDHQKAYFEQALVLAKTPAERASLQARSPKLEQTIVTAFGASRVDRCESCHIAVDDPRFENQNQPLRTHPYSAAMGDVLKNGRWERRHKFSDFGCTVCHDGQGRGLTKEDAHGLDLSWPSPMLGYSTQSDWKKDVAAHLRGPDYIQANCVRCHAGKDFAGASLVAQGRRLYFEKGCFGCHRIEGLSSGTLGVDLTEVGRERKLDYLWGHIVNPRDYTPTSIMPQFKLSDDERRALVAFLKSRQGANPGESAVEAFKLDTSTEKPVPESASAVASKLSANLTSTARGEQLIQGYACLSCHKLGDHDGGISPDLSYEGLIRDQAWLVDHFRSPRSRVPDSNMPAFGLPDADYQDMAAYLLTRTAPPPAMSPAETFKTLCARCHGENGDGKGINSIYLDPAPRDLTRAEFMNSKTDARFLASIANGVPGTSMPGWGRALTGDQIAGVLKYVQQTFVRTPRRELKPRKVPETNPVAFSDSSVSRGEHIFLQRCTGCHGRKADGRGPNSLDISPRPRNLRNAALIESLPDRRLFESIEFGVEGTAMPSWMDYGLSQNDVGDIVNYIRSLSKPAK
jgi:mono/diheme cytochrome c family protein